MLKKIAVLAGSVALAASFALPSVASASSLTNTQIQAIVSLLQSFGADSATIANVQAALGGSGYVGHTCQDFTDLKYGDFDSYPGGRVSQLQSWLGISANAFGYGTYGAKTLAAWRARCGGTVGPNTLIPSSKFFNFSLKQGGATGASSQLTLTNSTAYTVTYTLSVPNQPSWLNTAYATDPLTLQSGGVAGVGVSVDATGLSSGIYSTTLVVEGNFSTSPIRIPITLTVTGGVASATIDSSSLTSTSANPRLTGTAHGTSQIYLSVLDSSGAVAGYNGHMSATMDAYGNWGRNLSYLAPGAYTVKVYNESDGTYLTSATLVVLGGVPHASIDSNSLTANTGGKDAANVVITGTALNTSEVEVDLKGGTSAAAVVVNGRWSATLPSVYANQQYSVQVSNFDNGQNGSVLATGILSVYSFPVCPQYPASQRGQNGQQTECWCPANYHPDPGRVLYGGLTDSTSMGYYTDGSDVCQAGAQAGQLNLSSGGALVYTIQPGRNYYYGFTNNGITSQSYGWWPGSFQITGPKACLAAGTKISMADGSRKNIEDIKVGDAVKSLDGETAIVAYVLQREDPLLTINGVLKAAPDEVVYLANGVTKTADHLKIGDQLRGEDGHGIAVTSITSSSALAKTYDLKLETGKAFFADGFLVQSLDPSAD